jgi:hydrogenase nickel incorporation protein HypA/HybF
MHELSIARALVAVAERHLPPSGGDVRALRVAVGAATGVVPAALEWAFEAAAAGSRLAGARLIIERVAARSRCTTCRAEYCFDDLLGRCPVCGALGGELLAGEELTLRSLEVVDV